MSGILGHSGLLLAADLPISAWAWNPADTDVQMVLSGGNQLVTRGAAADGYKSVRGDTAITGKCYFELEVAFQDPTGQILSGVANASAPLSAYVGSDANGWAYANVEGKVYHDGELLAGLLPSGSETVVYGFSIDNDAGKVWIAVNNTLLAVGDPVAGTGALFTVSGTLYPACSIYHQGNALLIPGTLHYAPPAGFTSLGT